MLLPLIAAALMAGCTLPAHIAQTMPDDKLCSVRQYAVFHGFADDEHTRGTVEAERARRGLEPCVRDS
jgi:hypothetical protein